MITAVDKTILAGLLSIILFWAPAGLPSENNVYLLFDNFNDDSSDVDRSIWTSPKRESGCFGRTVIRNPGSTSDRNGNIQVSDGKATLILSTFNPTALVSGDSFLGSEIDSIKRFALTGSGGGIAISARVRWPQPLPHGIVTALFAFGLTRGDECDFKNEIDFEILSNYFEPGTKPTKVLINWYQDQPPGIGRPITVETPGLDLTRFNRFKIHWYADRIEWFINNKLIHQVTDNIPTDPMGVRLNIWGPAADFPLAFSPTLQPAAIPDQNRDYLFEIDWVKVSRIRPDPE